MDFFKNFELFFQQLLESQRMMFNNWGTMVSNVQNINPLSYPENFEKTVSSQEELVKNFLELQEQVSRLSIDSQRKIWDFYFQILRK